MKIDNMEIASNSDMSDSEDIDNENLSEENNEDEDNVAIDSDEEVFKHTIYCYYLDCLINNEATFTFI